MNVLRRMTDEEFREVMDDLKPMALAEAYVRRFQDRKNDENALPLIKEIRKATGVGQSVAASVHANEQTKIDMRKYQAKKAEKSA